MTMRHFTPDEADALLETVRPIVEELVEHRRAAAAAQSERRRLTMRVAGNGGGLDPGALAQVDEELGRALKGVARCVNAVHELGAVVKDADTGLVDFPARIEGAEAYLCWQLGEPEIAWWHGVEEGFAGRKPLDRR